jgi:RNA polymerase sigma-70 factor, ECF subfamily
VDAVQQKTLLSQAEALSDEALVERILQGETPLFELVMRRHNQRLYRAARAIVREEAEAEDVMQEAYVQAFAHLAQFNRQARLSTWLTKIAVHEAFARLRRTRRLADLELVSQQEPTSMPMTLSPPARTPEQQALSRELVSMLETALERLPAAARAAFVLRDVEGLSTSEAAECLDISEDALKTRLSRARALMREELFARVGAAASETFAFYAPRCDRVVAAVLQRLSGVPAVR